jgi:transcription elongation factor GreB
MKSALLYPNRALLTGAESWYGQFFYPELIQSRQVLMGRWRPPPPKSSPYITPQGEIALKKELQELWQLRRREVVPALSAAAAEGDRSENAEYIYRKKQLGEIDRRIRYLSKRLDVVEVVDRIPPQQDKVFFGAFVTLEDEQGAVVKYRIVGADEIDPALGFISVDSPMARALLGNCVDAEVKVVLPEKQAVFTVLEISYV